MDVQRTNLPQRFQQVALFDYEGDPPPGVVDYISSLKEHRQTGRGLLLIGPPGVGKTMLGAVVIHAALSDGATAYYIPFAGYIRRHLDLMRCEAAWKAGHGPEGFDEWRSTRDKLKWIRNDVEFLMLDDVGKEHSTNTRFAEDELDFLLRYRYDHGLPTIVTSNVPVSEWAAKYTDSMESFIHEACVVVPIAQADYRMKTRGEG